MPGFYLNSTAQAIGILDEVGAPTTRSCSTTSTTRSAWKASWRRRCRSTCARIGHIQVADNPGRHEPGTGEINYAFLFAHLDRIGYSGWVGCEYRPTSTTRGRARRLAAALLR